MLWSAVTSPVRSGAAHTCKIGAKEWTVKKKKSAKSWKYFIVLNGPPVVGRICKGENVVSCLSLTNIYLVSLACNSGMVGMMSFQVLLQFLHLVEAPALLGPIGACSTPLGKICKGIWMITEDLRGETFYFFLLSLCLFNNNPKIVINRGCIWSPLLFFLDFLWCLRTNLLSQREFYDAPLYDIIPKYRKYLWESYPSSVCINVHSHECIWTLSAG